MKDRLLLILSWGLKHNVLLPGSALGDRSAMVGFPQHWLGRVGNEIHLRWALFVLKNAHSEEQNPVYREFLRPLGCQTRGALSEMVAKRQGRVVGCSGKG